MFLINLLIFISPVFCKLPPIREDFLPSLGHRIANGVDTPIEDVPYQISVKMLGIHYCGGTIVAPKVVLSAAHCVAKVNTSMLTVVAGTSYRIKGGVERLVAWKIHHPYFKFTPTMEYDISVLYLVSPFVYSLTIQPARLPEIDEYVPPGTIATISGWGILKHKALDMPEMLQSTTVSILPQDVCIGAFRRYSIKPSMICAAAPEERHDACQGDSGGPLVVKRTLIGIISWGIGCARAEYPGVYTRLAAYRSWLNTVVPDLYML